MLATLLTLALVQSPLDDALDSAPLRNALAGTYVVTTQGKEVYGRLHDVRLVPASNQKILTGVFAIGTLGLGFRPETRFWRDGNRVYVDAIGDPTLTRAQLLEAKKRLGLTNDHAIYVRQPYRPVVPPSWEFDDLPHRYAARVTAFSFDRGGFEVWAENGRLRELDPAYKITLRHIPGAGSAKVEYRPDLRLAVVTGALPDSARMIEAFAVPDPDVIAARLLGGTIVHTSEPPPSRKPDYTITGPALREILKECLEKSDNNLAEHLMLMSATKLGPLGDQSYAEAAKRMKQFLEATVGVKADTVRPVDGSGMSRHNLVTPRAMGDVLLWAYRQSWRDEFLLALAATGEGTLSSRLRSSSFVGKTGTLSAVTCLSGYVNPGTDKTLVVSMLFNNTVTPASEVRAVQDRVVGILERG